MRLTDHRAEKTPPVSLSSVFFSVEGTVVDRELPAYSYLAHRWRRVPALG